MRPLESLLVLNPDIALLFGANSIAGDAETRPVLRTLAELKLDLAASRDAAGRR